MLTRVETFPFSDGYANPDLNLEKSVSLSFFIDELTNSESFFVFI